jgi:hypothetical protein
MIAFASHSIFARENLSNGVSDSNPAPYHSQIEYRFRILGFSGFSILPGAYTPHDEIVTCKHERGACASPFATRAASDSELK